MSVTLISFLGRGPYSPEGKRRDYYKTRYQFDNWSSREVSFFLDALLGSLPERRDDPPRESMHIK